MESGEKSHDQERPLDGGVMPRHDWWEVAERQDPKAQAQAEEALQKLRREKIPQQPVAPIEELPPEPFSDAHSS